MPKWNEKQHYNQRKIMTQQYVEKKKRLEEFVKVLKSQGMDSRKQEEELAKLKGIRDKRGRKKKEVKQKKAFVDIEGNNTAFAEAYRIRMEEQKKKDLVEKERKMKTKERVKRKKMLLRKTKTGQTNLSSKIDSILKKIEKK